MIRYNELKLRVLSLFESAGRDWLGPSEAAERLNFLPRVTPQAIENLMKKGRFRTLSIGGRVLLDRREVENYKAKRTGRPGKRTHSTG